MNLENQVCSLELAKRLKELGVKQESLFYWVRPVDEWHLTSVINQRDQIYFNNCTIGIFPMEHLSALNVAELGEMLPLEYLTVRIRGAYSTDKNMRDYWACYNDVDGIDKPSTQMELTEADVRAKMVIYLLENKLMELPK